MPELSSLSKHLIQQLSLSGIKAPSPHAGFVLLLAEEQAERRTPPGFLPLPSLNYKRTKRFTRQGSQLQGANDRNRRHPGLEECSKRRSFLEGEALKGRTQSQELGAQCTLDLPLGMQSTPRQKCVSSRKDALLQDCPPGIRQFPPCVLFCTAPGNCCLVSV